MKHFTYCDHCMMLQDFEVIEEETELGKEYRKTHDGFLPIGMGTNVIFRCVRCGRGKK